MSESGIYAKKKPLSFTFGDSRELCNWLLELVRSGKKTATCGALRDFTEGGEDLPDVGRHDIAPDWNSNPALLIETVEVSICRFRDVTEDFALAEGEGDFEDWRAGHIDYFTRNGGSDPDIELVCERFKLIEVLT